MKKQAFYILLMVVAAFWISCDSTKRLQDQDTTTSAPEPTSLLWKIEGGDGHPSYLFGTIHMIDEESYFFTNEMQAAFDTAAALALEFNLENAMDMGAQMGLLQQAFMKNDTTISDLVSDEEYEMIKAHFEDLGIPFFFLERIKPMFLTIFASEDIFSGGGMEDIKSYELELVKKAKLQSMPLQGLETMEYQISIFDSIPYRAQAEMLISTIQTGDEEETGLDSLVYYYTQQDLRNLDRLINSDETTRKYRGLLLDNRNRNWIPVMERLMSEQSMFFAVGAGHLSGEMGVIALLRKEGYTLSPIISTVDAAD